MATILIFDPEGNNINVVGSFNNRSTVNLDPISGFLYVLNSSANVLLKYTVMV